MRNKLYAGILSSLIIAIFLWCPLSYVLEKAGIITMPQMGNIKEAEKIYSGIPFSNVFNSIEHGKAALNNIYINHLPFYNSIIMTMKKYDIAVKQLLNTAFSTINPDTTEYSATLVGEDNVHYIYAIEPEGFLDTAVKGSPEFLKERLDRQLTHINRIARASTSVNFNLYIGTRLQDTDYFPNVVKGAVSTKEYMETFLEGLDNSIAVDFLKLDSVEQRMKYIFKTDHHWTAFGSYVGYTDIINMMSKKAPEIGSPRPVKEYIQMKGVKLRGSSARISLFDKYFDDFYVADIELPRHDISFHGDVDPNETKAVYMFGYYDRDLYADHYELFYPKTTSCVYPENKTARNLLLIGDSFSWCTAELLASHFDATYVYYPWDGQPIDYNHFIEENNITDVLFMQFSDRLFFNHYNDSDLNLIQTEQ